MRINYIFLAAALSGCRKEKNLQVEETVSPKHIASEVELGGSTKDSVAVDDSPVQKITDLKGSDAFDKGIESLQSPIAEDAESRRKIAEQDAKQLKPLTASADQRFTKFTSAEATLRKPEAGGADESELEAPEKEDEPFNEEADEPEDDSTKNKSRSPNSELERKVSAEAENSFKLIPALPKLQNKVRGALARSKEGKLKEARRAALEDPNLDIGTAVKMVAGFGKESPQRKWVVQRVMARIDDLLDAYTAGVGSDLEAALDGLNTNAELLVNEVITDFWIRDSIKEKVFEFIDRAAQVTSAIVFPSLPTWLRDGSNQELIQKLEESFPVLMIGKVAEIRIVGATDSAQVANILQESITALESEEADKSYQTTVESLNLAAEKRIAELDLPGLIARMDEVKIEELRTKFPFLVAIKEAEHAILNSDDPKNALSDRLDLLKAFENHPDYEPERTRLDELALGREAEIRKRKEKEEDEMLRTRVREKLDEILAAFPGEPETGLKKALENTMVAVNNLMTPFSKTERWVTKPELKRFGGLFWKRLFDVVESKVEAVLREDPLNVVAAVQLFEELEPRFVTQQARLSTAVRVAVKARLDLILDAFTLHKDMDTALAELGRMMGEWASVTDVVKSMANDELKNFTVKLRKVVSLMEKQGQKQWRSAFSVIKKSGKMAQSLIDNVVKEVVEEIHVENTKAKEIEDLTARNHKSTESPDSDPIANNDLTVSEDRLNSEDDDPLKEPQLDMKSAIDRHESVGGFPDEKHGVEPAVRAAVNKIMDDIIVKLNADSDPASAQEERETIETSRGAMKDEISLIDDATDGVVTQQDPLHDALKFNESEQNEQLDSKESFVRDLQDDAIEKKEEPLIDIDDVTLGIEQKELNPTGAAKMLQKAQRKNAEKREARSQWIKKEKLEIERLLSQATINDAEQFIKSHGVAIDKTNDVALSALFAKLKSRVEEAAAKVEKLRYVVDDTTFARIRQQVNLVPQLGITFSLGLLNGVPIKSATVGVEEITQQAATRLAEIAAEWARARKSVRAIQAGLTRPTLRLNRGPPNIPLVQNIIAQEQSQRQLDELERQRVKAEQEKRKRCDDQTFAGQQLIDASLEGLTEKIIAVISDASHTGGLPQFTLQRVDLGMTDCDDSDADAMIQGGETEAEILLKGADLAKNMYLRAQNKEVIPEQEIEALPAALKATVEKVSQEIAENKQSMDLATGKGKAMGDIHGAIKDREALLSQLQLIDGSESVQEVDGVVANAPQQLKPEIEIAGKRAVKCMTKLSEKILEILLAAPGKLEAEVTAADDPDFTFMLDAALKETKTEIEEAITASRGCPKAFISLTKAAVSDAIEKTFDAPVKQQILNAKKDEIIDQLKKDVEQDTTKKDALADEAKIKLKALFGTPQDDAVEQAVEAALKPRGPVRAPSLLVVPSRDPYYPVNSIVRDAGVDQSLTAEDEQIIQELESRLTQSATEWNVNTKNLDPGFSVEEAYQELVKKDLDQLMQAVDGTEGILRKIILKRFLKRHLETQALVKETWIRVNLPYIYARLWPWNTGRFFEINIPTDYQKIVQELPDGGIGQTVQRTTHAAFNHNMIHLMFLRVYI